MGTNDAAGSHAPGAASFTLIGHGLLTGGSNYTHIAMELVASTPTPPSLAQAVPFNATVWTLTVQPVFLPPARRDMAMRGVPAVHLPLRLAPAMAEPIYRHRDGCRKSYRHLYSHCRPSQLQSLHPARAVPLYATVTPTGRPALPLAV
ncbi:MAG: hypothetical protein R2788_02355 [Saprospiraceae bacterium]